MKYVNAVIRIAITVAIVNATARVGFAYWGFFQLKDHAQQTAVFGAQAPPDVLQTAVLERANELFLPLHAHQVNVTRRGPRTLIEANYELPIEYFPNKRYPMKFSFAVEGFALSGAGSVAR